MRTQIAPFLIVVLFCSLMVACGWGGSTSQPAAPLTVLSPNGGESWIEGTPRTVTWQTDGYVGVVDIEYTTDGGATWHVLAGATPNDGSEDVTCPATATGTACVQVSACDGDPAVVLAPADQSDGDFTIVARVVVISPNGGEAWTVSSTVPVTWEPGRAYTGNVDIELSTNAGATWTTLAADTPNDGSEDVTCPATPSPSVRVQVSAADGNPAVALAPSDASDANVRISGPWVDIGAGLTGVTGSSLAWGDYDDDGDLDLALAGYGGRGTSQIYRNDADAFTDIVAGLLGVSSCSLGWGDYDNDGDLDLAVAGSVSFGSVSRVYRNDGGTFADIGAGLPGVGYGSSLVWGDYDNDGDLDLALAGSNGTGARLTRIYRNDAGRFTDIAAGLPGVESCSLAWADYDNDGDLDLALAGRSGMNVSTATSRIYRNDAGTFTDIEVALVGVRNGSLVWGDYDNDGDLDLALAGLDGSSLRVSRIYRNDGGPFTDIGAGLQAVSDCSLAWADFDNDGDLDLALAGDNGGGRITRIYENDNGVFTDIAAGLPGVSLGALAWGDYDNDGDLDLAVAGRDEVSASISCIYRNDGGFWPNTLPSAPTDVRASSGGGVTVVTWMPAGDLETPADGLSYNLRIGLTPTDDGDYPSMADGTGRRSIPTRGPIASTPLFGAAWLTLPPGETYYVSVQAVDTSFEGGPWSTPVSVTVPFDHTSAELKGLSASAGAFSPAFNAATFTYDLSSPTLPETTTITATSADPEATIRVNSVDTPSGTVSAAIPLPAGLTTTTVTIEVTARDGLAQRTYTIVFTRTDGGSGPGDHSGGGGER